MCHSLASLDNDQDYQYLKGYSKDSYGKPMTAKDRARHGMLRMMLRKQLEVTRPVWPKHPAMRSTDRIVDEERGLIAKEKKSAEYMGMTMSPARISIGVGALMDSQSMLDLQALARRPMLSVSPEFSRIGKTMSPAKREPPNQTQTDPLMYRGLEATVGR